MPLTVISTSVIVINFFPNEGTKIQNLQKDKYEKFQEQFNLKEATKIVFINIETKHAKCKPLFCLLETVVKITVQLLKRLRKKKLSFLHD